MCGNFLVTAEGQVLPMKLFNEWRLARIIHGLEKAAEWYPMFITKPSNRLPVVKQSARDPAQLEFDLMEWGLHAKDWGDPGKVKAHINAKGETVHRLPSFRNSFFKYRCLALADGFFEPDRITRQPWLIRFKDKRLFAFAAIYSPVLHHEESGRDYNQGFCLITTEPNELVGKTVNHHRMPVILSDPEAMKLWLHPEADPEELKDLLQPHPDGEWETYQVARSIYTKQAGDASILAPQEPQAPTTQTTLL
jgi:putative SOS response-associated peptidase YedK